MTLHRNTTVDGLNVLYRESGSKDAPTNVLLQGSPTALFSVRAE